MDARDTVVAWLNDAYAMEQALEKVLVQHAKDAEGHPEVRSRIEDHVVETREQADTVAGCIESLGGSVSGAKSAFGSMFGAMQSMANKPMGDTMVKNALADYAAEHFEIACYRALIEACRSIGEDDVASRLTPVLHEEEGMARFLEQSLPRAVGEALAG